MLGALALALSGCKSPREKHEAAVRQLLTELPSLASKVAAVGPQGEASPELKSISDCSCGYPKSNALVIHLDELSNPTLRRKLAVRAHHRSPTVDAATALNAVRPQEGALIDSDYRPGTDSEANMETVWPRLGELRYVLVVRSREYEPPQLTGASEFRPGTWKGDVLVYAWPQQRLVGGFGLAASNGQTVQTRTGRNQENLLADLNLSLSGALDARLRELIPSIGPSDNCN